MKPIAIIFLLLTIPALSYAHGGCFGRLCSGLKGQEPTQEVLIRRAIFGLTHGCDLPHFDATAFKPSDFVYWMEHQIVFHYCNASQQANFEIYVPVPLRDTHHEALK